MIESRVEECCLVGGPDYMPDSFRRAEVLEDCLKVKVQFCNGCEHFERTPEFTDLGAPIFRWTMRTLIAE